MADSKPRPDASASAASTDSDAKADPKSVTGVEQPAEKPEEAAPEQPAEDDAGHPAEDAPTGDASAKPAANPEAAPADTGDAEPAPEQPAPEQPAVDYKALAEAARAELDNLKAKLATQESLKSAGLAPELADYVTLNTPEDAQKLAALIAPQPTQAPFAPVGDDDSDENITTIGNRIFGRR